MIQLASSPGRQVRFFALTPVCVSHPSRIDHHPLDDYPVAAMSMAGDVIEMAAHGLIQPF